MMLLKMDTLDMLEENKKNMKEKISVFIKKNHSKWTKIKLSLLVVSVLIFYSYPLFNLDIHNSKQEFILSILKGLSSQFIVFYIIFIPLFFIELFLLIFFKAGKKKVFLTLAVLFFYIVCVFTAYDKYAVYKFHQELKER